MEKMVKEEVERMSEMRRVGGVSERGMGSKG